MRTNQVGRLDTAHGRTPEQATTHSGPGHRQVRQLSHFYRPRARCGRTWVTRDGLPKFERGGALCANASSPAAGEGPHLGCGLPGSAALGSEAVPRMGERAPGLAYLPTNRSLRARTASSTNSSSSSASAALRTARASSKERTGRRRNAVNASRPQPGMRVGRGHCRARPAEGWVAGQFELHQSGQ